MSTVKPYEPLWWIPTMATVNPADVPILMRRLRHRRRPPWSMADFAAFMGKAPHGSSYQDFEKPERQLYMPREHMENLAKHIVGQGEPPVTRDELLALAGIEPPLDRLDAAASVLAMESMLLAFAALVGVAPENIPVSAAEMARAATNLTRMLSEKAAAGTPLSAEAARGYADGLIQGLMIQQNRKHGQTGPNHQQS